MATREFPALGFDPAPGDAGALGSAAEAVTGAGTLFGTASGNVTRLNSSGWTGDAAEAFRGQLKDLPRDLDLAARSHGTAARALRDYGTGLAVRQRRATELETRAAALRQQESAAVAQVNSLARRTAPAGSAEFTSLKNQYDSARSRATTLGSDLQAVIAEARRLHADHRSAADEAARKIRDVADAPYKEPGWLSKAWSGVKGWIADHADVLTAISGVLKGISAVLGVLSFVPGLQFLAPFAIAAAGIALAIDVAVKLATGKGSWTAIGIDAALTFLPGGKILSGLKGIKAAKAARVLKGNPTRGLGSTAVHGGNAGNAVVRRLFPELSTTNPLFRLTKATDGLHPRVGGPGFRNNCQSCVTAVDNQLAGLSRDTRAIERVFGPGDQFATAAWKQNIAKAAGTTDSFTPVSSYDDIATQLHNAGEGSRGIIHGMRVGPGGVPQPGHVFNVVNRNGRIFFLDGQTGKLAHLENYSGGLEFLRTK